MQGKILGVLATDKVSQMHVWHSDGTAEHTYEVAKGATIALNGKTCHLADLKVGDRVEGDPAKSLVVTR